MVSDRARAIHTDLPVVDGHNDLPWKIRTSADGDLSKADPRKRLVGYHTDVPRMIEGGVGAQLWSVYVPAEIAHPFDQTLNQIQLVEEMIALDDRLEPARTGSDARRIRDSGRIASLMGAEGGHSIENSLDRLAILAERGVRYMTLTHSDTHEWADSATDDPIHCGLSDRGRDVVREMNRLGMLVDISHVSAQSMRDALDASAAPVIASHSNAYSLAPHPRNIPDDVLREVGRRRGVVMVVFFPGFVVAETARQTIEMFDRYRSIRAELGDDEAAIAAEIERLESQMSIDQGNVSNVVDHIEYIAEVAGVETVGLGSDFDGMTSAPVGLEDVSRYPAITDELLTRGWIEDDIRRVLGENALRLLDVGPVDV